MIVFDNVFARPLPTKGDNMEGIMQIDFSDIVPSHDYDEKIFQYFNPRLLINSKNDNSYASQSIAELKDSIRMFGLQQMFIINRIDNKNYLLDGHRRREAISQLIKEDAVCFNEKAKSWVKASLLYSKMNVQFHENLHTADAFSKVFCIDNNKIVFDDNVIIKFIDYCNQANIAKENIAKMCHKPIPYVKQVLSILSGLEDDDTLKEQLFEGKIVLSAAEDLVEEFPEANDRNDIIEQAWDYAEDRAKRKIQKIDDSILTAVIKLNKAKQAKADLVASGSFSEIPDVDEEIDQHMKEVQERKEQRNRQSPTIQKKDTENAAKAKGKTPKSSGSKPKAPKISAKQIVSWHDAVKKCSRNGNLTDDGDYIPPLINMFIDDLMKTMEDNEEDVNYGTFLQQWVPQFLDNGLDANAGMEAATDAIKTPFDDDDSDLSNVVRTEQQQEDEEEDLN